MDYEITISRTEFEQECVKELIPRFEKCIERVLYDSDLKKEQINLVLPIGGTCRVPIVMNTIKRFFPKESQMADPTFDPLTAVANGAAFHSYRLSLSGDVAAIDLREKLPYSIGIRLVNDVMDFLGNKGDLIPLETSSNYWPAYDNQPAVSFSLYTGESKKTTDPGMKCLGSMRIILPPNTKSDQFQMLAKINITSSGLIEMSAHSVKDGRLLKSMQVQIEMNKLDEKLSKLSKHLAQFLN